MHRRKPIKFLPIHWYKLIISALMIDNQTRYLANGRLVKVTNVYVLAFSIKLPLDHKMILKKL